MIPIKTSQEIEKMKKAGHILAKIMDELALKVKPDTTTIGLDLAARLLMDRFKVRPAFKGYRGYPANICASVNEEVVHGIPGERKLIDGDIISIDIGIELDGFYSDMAKTFTAGRADSESLRLIETTKASLDEALSNLGCGRRLSEASCAVQRYVEARGFSVVRDFVGHGIGRALHEEPQIPNFKTPQEESPLLKEGMVLAIEPMINAGGWEVDILKDGWTAVTRDRKRSAHFEHTVAILKNGPEILTR